jgi:hypothetical protein
MVQDPSPNIASSEDQFLSFAALGSRWHCHPKVAAKRVKELRIPILRFNVRTLFVRLEDVRRVEAQLVIPKEEIEAELASAKDAVAK